MIKIFFYLIVSFCYAESQEQQIYYNTINISNNFFSEELARVIKNSIGNKYKALNDTQHALYNRTKKWLCSNKLTRSIQCCLATYTLLQIYGIYLTYELDHRYRWSLWKQEKISFQTDELLAAIQQKYIQAAIMTDAITPLISFLKDLEREERYLCHFITFSEWSEKWYLTHISYYKPERRCVYERRLEQLLILKKIFLDWLSAFKTRNIN